MSALPCPFCGSENIRAQSFETRALCMDCQAFGPPHMASPIAAWNKRAPDGRIKALREALWKIEDYDTDWALPTDRNVEALRAIARAAIAAFNARIDAARKDTP